MYPERSGLAVRSAALFGRHGAALFGRRLHVFIDSDGSYRLTKDIPAGEYRVTVTSAPGGGVRVPVKYANRETTPLSCTLRRGTNVIDLDLTN